MLGGIGLDALDLAWSRRTGRWWVSVCGAFSAACLLGGIHVNRAEPWLRERARHHYQNVALSTSGADSQVYQRRAERQVAQALSHGPRVLLITGAEVAALAALALLAHRGKIAWPRARLGLIVLTLGELLVFGRGLNPAIERDEDRPIVPVIARLRHEVGRSGRILGLGQELLPNIAMRYGLADPRNYDSVELKRALDWFSPLFEESKAPRSSRGTITWNGVRRARERLREACVVAVVAATPPPPELDAHVDRLGLAWVARLEAPPLVSLSSSQSGLTASIENGSIHAEFTCSHEDVLVVRQVADPGWRAELDGRPAPITPYLGTFLSVRVGAGTHRVSLVYDPPEVRAACVVSLSATIAALFALTGLPTRRLARNPHEGLGSNDPKGLESFCDLHRIS
ncbi:MAG: hypothetical protein NVSMB9_16150 [Isosphaeraceae bacterium]